MRGAARVFKNCLRFHMANDDEGGKGRNCNKTPVNPTAKLARRSRRPSEPLAGPGRTGFPNNAARSPTRGGVSRNNCLFRPWRRQIEANRREREG